MRALVMCEFSGRVRDALRRHGVDAWSVDLLPCDADGAYHVVGDAFDVFAASEWDMVIAHPPCTHLASSGARHFAAKRADGRQAVGIEFFQRIAALPAPRLAIENPVGIMSSVWRKPDQIVQPWWFGDGETKATCWWLRGLPLLVPTNIVAGRAPVVHMMPPGPDRWKRRSVEAAIGDVQGHGGRDWCAVV